MEISFKDKKLKKHCEDITSLKKSYGAQAPTIMQRINEIKAAESLLDISKLPHLRLHPLQGTYKNCYAIDIKHPYRIIISPQNGTTQDYKTIGQIMIIDIIDYH
jgi:proteic killer suppression protein